MDATQLELNWSTTTPTELSREQMSAVYAGSERRDAWMPCPMPTWPFERPLPSWMLDCMVDWNDQYSNPPDVKFLTNGTEWEGPWLYEYDPKRKLYIATIDDRVSWHSHGPLLSEIDYETAFIGMAQGPNKRPNAHSHGVRLVETEKRWATAPSQGYAGRSFPIDMKDGRKAVLRGPWFVSPPDGYKQVTVYNINRRMWKGHPTERQIKSQTRWGRKPRWDITGNFGLGVSYDLITRAIARFQPHLRLAWVKRYKWIDLEPRFAGQAPKGMVITDQDLSQD